MRIAVKIDQNPANSRKFVQIHTKMANKIYQGVRTPESRRPKACKIEQIRALGCRIVQIRTKQNRTKSYKLVQIHTKIANQSYQGCAPHNPGVQNRTKLFKFVHNGAKLREFVSKSYKIVQIRAIRANSYKISKISES